MTDSATVSERGRATPALPRSVRFGHSIHAADIHGGGWDWTTGERPRTKPAYYLRFCKSYARMGGTMRYIQADNAAFTQH